MCHGYGTVVRWYESVTDRWKWTRGNIGKRFERGDRGWCAYRALRLIIRGWPPSEGRELGKFFLLVGRGWGRK